MTLPYDVLLDPVTGDLPDSPTHANNEQIVMQWFAKRANTWRGEWVEDVEFGVPWNTFFQDPQADTEGLRAFLIEYLGATTGVERIERLVVELDVATQTFVIRGEGIFSEDASRGFEFQQTTTADEVTAPFLTILSVGSRRVYA